MNIDSISIEFDFAEGIVRRLLGVVEARGFRVRTMTMNTDIESSSMTLGLSARDEGRRIDVLSRQITRLQGVRGVSRLAPAPYVVAEAAHAADG